MDENFLILGDSVDHLVTLDMKWPGRPRGVVDAIYAACRNFLGQPCCLAAAHSIQERVSAKSTVIISTGFVLPPLANEQVWNTYTLNTSGTLSVVVLNPPTIASLNIAAGNVIIGGSGGAKNWPYYLLASTNLSSAPAQWTRVATNQFDGSGDFAVTNAINPMWPQTFYRLQLQ